MRYLLLSSFVVFLLLSGCASVYKGLEPATGNISQLQKFRPDFRRALYKADVDVTSHHLSGLLLIKTLPDSSVRMVFSSEMGMNFFDFEYKPDGSFKVHSVVKQMDKGPVIKTLKKDLELIMLPRKDFKDAYMRKDAKHLYYIFPQKKGTYCYVTNLQGSELIKMQICSPRKPIVEAHMKNYQDGIPDTIGISHLNFKFTIGLKRLER